VTGTGTERVAAVVSPASAAGRGEERLASTAGTVAVLTVGAAQVVVTATNQLDVSAARGAVWWSAYLVYLLLFLAETRAPARRPPWSPRVGVAGMLVAGVTTWLVVPQLDWAAVLFVVTAASAAFVLTPPTVVAVVTLQTLATALGAALAGRDTFGTVFTTTVYLTFQAFAVLVVRSTIREAAAGARLAESNAELAAATTLLADATRASERLRIARDLHDVVGHRLTALALELEIASHQATPPALEHVTRARREAKELLGDVRAVVSELRDGAVGLEPALRRVLDDLPGLAVDLEVAERRVLDEAHALAVVRLVQEVATNTLRHASATRLSVQVVADDAGLRVEARDDGTGAARWLPGNGLLGMRERFARLGGEVVIDPGPHRGFVVTARAPLP
jgi:signal transduction histidine kinase